VHIPVSSPQEPKDLSGVNFTSLCSSMPSPVAFTVRESPCAVQLTLWVASAMAGLGSARHAIAPPVIKSLGSFTFYEHFTKLDISMTRLFSGIIMPSFFIVTNLHDPRPNLANAAALRSFEDAATSAAGPRDLDFRGSDATAE